MLTERDIAKALEKCKVLNSHIDDEDKTAVVLDGYFDLARAARLLSRLERMRQRKPWPDPFPPMTRTPDEWRKQYLNEWPNDVGTGDDRKL